MTARLLKRRADRPGHLMGISETRINMLKANISMQDLVDRVYADDNFKISVSAVSNCLDEKLVEYINIKARQMCEEAPSWEG